MRSARRAVVSMLVVTIVLSATSTPTSAGGRHDEPRGTPREGVWGIDVSHHQGRIDWGRVARAGYHFAIAKATEGRTWVDRTYPRNRAQAEANGLAFGAYHFARPGGGTHDAVREANHFVEVARLRPGDIIPVLDLESSGGLSRRRLTRWILAWLRQVRRRLGVRPMVYTSPRGWAERTGDTSAIARAGFDALWVAHWEVREPSLPAKAWGGHGWSLWQRDTCGRVPGVRGCVDIDRVAGPSLEPLRIDTADPGPPAVRIAPPETLTDAVVIRFDEVVAWISRGNVVLRTSRGSRPPVELTCRSGIGWPVDCGSGDVRKVLVRPRRPLVAGRTYRVVVNGAAAEDLVRDRSGTSAPEVARTFTAPTRLEQGSAAIAYRGPGTWRVLEPRGRPGGRVASTSVAGASAELTFVGTGLAWTTAVGPRHGLAEIRVDGRRVGSVDTYAREPGLAVHRIHGLAPGTHTIRIVVLGRRAARAEGTIVAVDRVRVLSQPARRGGGQLPAAHDPGFPEPWGPGRAPARPVIDPR